MRLDITIHPDGSVTGRQTDTGGLAPPVTPAPTPSPVPTPTPTPAPVPTGPVVPSTIGPKANGHIANVKKLFNESNRGKSLSAMYFEDAALVWKSKLQNRVEWEVFNGNRLNYLYWTDFRTNYSESHSLNMEEAMRLKAMAAQANAL